MKRTRPCGVFHRAVFSCGKMGWVADERHGIDAIFAFLKYIFLLSQNICMLTACRQQKSRLHTDWCFASHGMRYAWFFYNRFIAVYCRLFSPYYDGEWAIW